MIYYEWKGPKFTFRSRFPGALFTLVSGSATSHLRSKRTGEGRVRVRGKVLVAQEALQSRDLAFQ